MQQYGSFNPGEFDSSYAKGGGVTLNLYMSRTFGWMFLGLMVTFALAWYMAASGLVIRLLMTTPSILMILLVAVALLPGWADSGANVLVSYVCAVQVQSFRKVAGSAFATTMCTGNLRSGTEALYRGWLTGEREHLRRAGRYYGIIVFFCAGAALGAWCSGAWGRRAVLAASLLLFAAFLLMFRRKNTCGEGESGIK